MAEFVSMNIPENVTERRIQYILCNQNRPRTGLQQAQVRTINQEINEADIQFSLITRVMLCQYCHVIKNLRLSHQYLRQNSLSYADVGALSCSTADSFDVPPSGIK